METLKTHIVIDASPQTVWSILDDLEKYPEWNKLIPELAGHTRVGEIVTGRLVQPDTPVIPLLPTLTRIVGARELRWLTVVPGEQGFSAEHYFLLTPTLDGGTVLIHGEDFDGPAIEFMWENIDTNGRVAYNLMNTNLKARAQSFKVAAVSLHPCVDAGLSNATPRNRLKLSCHCLSDQVEVTVEGSIHHNHLCGCSKCWKPAGALLAQTAIAAADLVHIYAGKDKLICVDPAQSIKRFACQACGVHMLGYVEDPEHHFYRLAFIHPELSQDTAPMPEFAGFVSSIIETGASPSLMEAVRDRLQALAIPAYDVFSPELMDIIAWHKVKTIQHRTKSNRPT